MIRKRTIIIGDIHGCYDELKNLLKKCNFNPENDRCIFAGDLLDRGPRSIDVVDFAMKYNIEISLGNHDDKYIQYSLMKKTRIPPVKFEIYKNLGENRIDFLKKQKFYILLPEYNTMVVHAGVLPDKSLFNQSKNTYLYTRYVNPNTLQKLHLGPNHSPPSSGVHWTKIYNGEVDIVYGHDVQSLTEPNIYTNTQGARTIGIDTGACFGGHLTAFILSDENPRGCFEQVKSTFNYRQYQITLEQSK